MHAANDKIGPYTLVRKLGQGGFGVVWLASDSSSIVRDHVALKLPIGDEIDAEKMRQEAALWLKASGHPNILPVIDARIYDGQVAIVTEYMPDGTLGDLLERNGGTAPAPEWAVMATVGILKGLEHLHSLHMVHRDLKPNNVLMDGDTPRLTDFGLTRILRTSNRNRLSDGAATFPYTAPEMFRGTFSEQSDVWAAGVILYQMLAGALPFPAEHHAEIMYAICNSEPLPLPDSVPAKLREIVANALTKDLGRRFPTARAMRDALQPHPSSDLRNKSVLAVPAMEETLHIAKARPAATASIEKRPLSATLQASDALAAAAGAPGYGAAAKAAVPSAVPTTQVHDRRAFPVKAAVGAGAVALVAVCVGLYAILSPRSHGAARPPAAITAPSPPILPAQPTGVAAVQPVNASTGNLSAGPAGSGGPTSVDSGGAAAIPGSVKRDPGTIGPGSGPDSGAPTGESPGKEALPAHAAGSTPSTTKPDSKAATQSETSHKQSAPTQHGHASAQHANAKANHAAHPGRTQHAVKARPRRTQVRTGTGPAKRTRTAQRTSRPAHSVATKPAHSGASGTPPLTGSGDIGR